MGTIMDLTKMSGHDYVDNKYFSVQEVYVKLFAYKNRLRIMDLDRGKVLLFVNMTLEKEKEQETSAMLADMQRILNKYSANGETAGKFAVYAQFTHDVEGGESLLNKDIAG